MALAPDCSFFIGQVLNWLLMSAVADELGWGLVCWGIGCMSEGEPQTVKRSKFLCVVGLATGVRIGQVPNRLEGVEWELRCGEICGKLWGGI